jgi:hypothetical protein
VVGRQSFLCLASKSGRVRVPQGNFRATLELAAAVEKPPTVSSKLQVDFTATVAWDWTAVQR